MTVVVSTSNPQKRILSVTWVVHGGLLFLEFFSNQACGYCVGYEVKINSSTTFQEKETRNSNPNISAPPWGNDNYYLKLVLILFTNEEASFLVFFHLGSLDLFSRKLDLDLNLRPTFPNGLTRNHWSIMVNQRRNPQLHTNQDTLIS